MQSNHLAQACINLSDKLNGVSVAQSKCTIYRVHRHLRNINDKSYEPEAIAIGPYHRDKDNLKMMEDHKVRYLHLLLQRKNENVDKYVAAVEPLEPEARKCYANPISLNKTEFIEMLILDGCFIIELVRKYKMTDLRDENDAIFCMDWIINSLQRDLMLFENQIPFSVLCTLFDLIEVPGQRERLIHLVTVFFGALYPGKIYPQSPNGRSPGINHLLDLIRINLLSSLDLSVLDEVNEDRRKGEQMRFIVNAACLREANVKFKRNDGVSLFDIRFKHGTMSLPPLNIEDRTESLLTNLITYEQYCQDVQTTFVMDYVKFLDCLIDSSADVEILSRFGIINNSLGDNGVVADMFNKLTDLVAGLGNTFIYGKIFNEVNEHCKKHRKGWMATLWRKHLNSPWALISVIAAIVLLVVTVAQVAFAILPVVKPPKQ